MCRDSVENGLEWMKGYQYCAVTLTHVAAGGTEKAYWTSEIVGRISRA